MTETSALGTTTSETSTATTTSATSGTSSSGTTHTETKSWRDSLPEEIRTHASISSFKDVESLTKSYIHANSLVGKKGVIVPGEKSTDDDWKSFYQQIGVPPAEKYEITPPKEYKLQDGVLNTFKEHAIKNGLLPKQANQMIEWYAGWEKSLLESQAKAKTATVTQNMDALKKEWGEGYDKELAGARVAVKELGGEPLIKYLNESGLGNDTTLIKVFAKAAKLLKEDTLREGGVSSQGQTPEEIHAALAELRANGDSNGLYNRSHPGHASVMAKFESLNKKLTGGR